MKYRGIKDHIVRVAIIMAFFLVMADLAIAHNVTIFAWVEGDMVHTESKFARGRKAKNAPIEVYDATGKKLLEGKTDENGEFSFKAPAKTDLTIVLIAGMGHRAEWMVTASEFNGGTDAAPPETQTANRDLETKVSDTVTKTRPAQQIDMENITKVIEKALDKKLQPVMKILVESQEKNPSINDIFGGIGYIFGLMGVAAYVRYRKKS